MGGSTPWDRWRLIRLAAATAAGFLASAVLPALATAATITVNTPAWNGPTSGECHGVAGDCSLPQAVDKASPGDTIRFAASLKGKTIDASDLSISKSLKIIGPGDTKLTLSGSGSSRILDVTTSPVTVSGLKLALGGTGGFSPSSAIGYAGATGKTLTLSNDLITKSTSGSGPAISMSSGNLAIVRSTVSGNTGGGVVQYGTGTITITRSTLAYDAYGSYDSGGAVFVQGQLLVTNSTFSHDSGATGGAIYLQTASGTISTIKGSTFTGNYAWSNTTFNPSGGAIFVQTGRLDIINSTLTGNSAYSTGGGAGFGGAIFTCCNASPVLLLDDTLDANTVTGAGSSGGNVTTGSSVGYAVVARDTIIAAGKSGSPGYNNCGEHEASEGHNLSSDSSCGLTSTGDKQNTNPKLGKLAHNGGPTETMALLAGSPAIDHGETKSSCTTTDQRGLPRPDHHESVCDIGAYEYQDPGAH